MKLALFGRDLLGGARRAFASFSGEATSNLLFYLNYKSQPVIEAVSDVLKKGADLNAKDPAGHTALMLLAGLGESKAVSLALKRGAKPDIKVEGHGKTALMFAAESGDVATISLLLDAGSNVNDQSCYGVTPLVLAARKGRLKAVKLLLERGADIELTGVWGETPLMAASMYGHFEVVKELVQNRANILHENINRQNSIMVAAQPGIRSYLKGIAYPIVKAAKSEIMGLKEGSWQERLLSERAQTRELLR
jgi:ankyrin repeat protein